MRRDYNNEDDEFTFFLRWLEGDRLRDPCGDRCRLDVDALAAVVGDPATRCSSECAVGTEDPKDDVSQDARLPLPSDSKED